MGANVEVEASTTSIERGDVYLLCTRGIYSSLGDGRLEDILHQHCAAPRVCVRELLDAAAANGGGASLTAVVIALGEHSGADAAGMDAAPEDRLVAG